MAVPAKTDYRGLVQMLASANKSAGLPAGTMEAVMQQESGGMGSKYVADPSAYHYALNGEGRRVAGHTGKVSTAFGPFGILESTAKDPGYGVKPLQDKSMGEQIRFAAEYAAARARASGSLEKGLAGYGEGGKYAKEVMARISAGNGGASTVPVQVGGGREETPLGRNGSGDVHPANLAYDPAAFAQLVQPQGQRVPVQEAQQVLPNWEGGMQLSPEAVVAAQAQQVQQAQSNPWGAFEAPKMPSMDYASLMAQYGIEGNSTQPAQLNWGAQATPSAAGPSRYIDGFMPSFG